MGNLDRLLEALAKQLPSSADRSSIGAALKEAAKALPETQAKTRTKLARDEQTCIEKLEALLKETVEEAAEEPAADVVVASEVVDAKEDPAMAAYADVNEGDHAACVARCGDLLLTALSGLGAAKLAEEALEGLMAILPSGGMSLDTLVLCMELLPSATAALGPSASRAWCRFLGFLLATLARVEVTKASQREAKEVATRLGGLVALSAQHSSARAALRRGLSTLDEMPGASGLACLATAVLPVIRAAFRGVNAFTDVEVGRSDLTALLHSLQFIGLCRKAGAGESLALNEACDLLRTALTHHFDASVLLTELKRMGVMSAKRRRVDKEAEGKGRAASAKVVSDAILASPEAMGASAILRLVNTSGLPQGEEEDTDRRAAAARARGDLFFEDTSGSGTGVLQEVAAKAAANALGQLDGVEALAAKKKKKRKSLEN